MNSDPKKIYFASDQHFGIPDAASSKLREKKFISWLDEVKTDAKAIFLLGDLFDFWFEYKTVVPRGFIRVLGKIAELKDSGIPIYFFVGNHDLWMIDYFETELGIPVYRHPKEFVFDEITGSRGKKPIMSVLNKSKLSKHEMDDLCLTEE